ncbi:MAG: hypothetical protein K6F71_13175 [Ruminococcus sp.]|uniref:hypothetical protein n=1 Tax=Ruminococcus sp. TaxID=41978 RepID=UPI0025D6DBB6|nr:hypothetical protein [Ruminococcus sp.]MCR5541753.1 hypothetical protein [Ruminococcus sp.]
MFGKTSFFDKEMKRAEKSARAFAKRNRKEAKEVEAIMNGKKRPSMDYFEDINRSGSAGNETLQFFMGFLLLGGGLYWLLNSFTVSSGFGMGMYSLFGMQISGGVMLIPLLVGIGLIFFLDGKKRFIGYCVSALGLLAIVISLLTSLQFRAKHGYTLYVYVIMFGMIFAGAALLLKSSFKKKS